MGGTGTNLLRPYSSLSLVANLRTTIPQRTVSLELALFVGDLAGLFVDVRIGDKELGAGGLGSQVVALSDKSSYVSMGMVSTKTRDVQSNRLSWVW